MGCSLNLDATQKSFGVPTQDNLNFRGRQRRRRRTMLRSQCARIAYADLRANCISWGSFWPSCDTTTAQLDSTPYVRYLNDLPCAINLPRRANSNVQRNRVTDFASAAGVLPPVPSGYWRQAGQAPSTLLAFFFNSEFPMLRVANAGAGRAFLGRLVTGAGGHECAESSIALVVRSTSSVPIRTPIFGLWMWMWKSLSTGP